MEEFKILGRRVKYLRMDRGITQTKMADFFVDFDDEAEEATTAKSEGAVKQAIELEDAVQILRLLKAVEIKGV